MASWAADTLLPSYEAIRIPLPQERTFDAEPAGSLVATLVRRNAPAAAGAVLYIHGWSDYFFQQHLADEMAGAGRDFYAIDLRRYGRSLLEGQLGGFITDLGDYFVELDEALRLILADGHDDVVLMGHSTGGLIAALWADARPGSFSAVVLNSPWLDLQGGSLVRDALNSLPGNLTLRGAVGALPATAILPLPDNGFYERAIHASGEGEWDYDLRLKGDATFRPRAGWMAAVLRGHRRVARGLAIDAPVLVALSDRSSFARTWNEDLLKADIILDVARLAARVPGLCSHVTLVRIAGGMHDLALSPEPVRRAFFDEVARWLRYVEPSLC